MQADVEMKTKKQICAVKSNMIKRIKKLQKTQTNPKLKKWQFVDNVKIFKNRVDSEMCVGSFHEAIKPVLVIGQFFGVMPVLNVTAACPNSLRYSWKSLRVFFALFVTASCGFEALLTVYWSLSKKLEFGKMVILVFYVTNFLSFACFLKLARDWPDLMIKWRDVEKKLPPYRNKDEKQLLKVRIRFTAFVILTLSLIEHILSIVSAVAQVVDCPRIKSIYRAYYIKSFPQVFTLFPYSTVLGTYIKFIHVTSTFVWSFTDLFIMMISCGLSLKFKLINERMLEDKGKYMPPEYWSDQRRYYRHVCELVMKIDDKISFITILSVSNNLFFICVQLLNSMDIVKSFAHGLYFWFSLIYLIVRTLAVSLYSAEINDESKRPVECFRASPRESWCTEIRRFIEEVNFDVVALSGKKFFYLTRTLVLSVAGTIVTYELVLIQFKTNDDITDYDPCWTNVTTVF